MAQLPFDEYTGQKMVEQGVLSADTFARAKQSNSFAPITQPVLAAEEPQGDMKPAIVQAAEDKGSQIASQLQDQYLAPREPWNPGETLDRIGSGVNNAVQGLQGLGDSLHDSLVPGARPRAQAPAPAQSREPSSMVASADPKAAAVPASLDKKNPEYTGVDPSQLATVKPQAQAKGTAPETDYMGQMKASGELQMQAAKDMEAAGKAHGAYQAGVYQGLSTQMKEAQLKEQKLEQEQDAYAKNQITQFEKETSEIAKSAQIDPNRYWNNMSSGNKVMAAIAIGLGAVGGTFSGQGGNVALDIINKAIDRDIDAQKANALNKRQGLSDKINIYNMNMKRFGDQRLAMAATQTQMLQMANLQIQASAAKFQGAESASRAKMLQGQIMGQIAQNTMAMQQMLKQKAALEALSGGGQDLSGADLMALPKEQRELYVQGPGFRGLAYTAEGAKAIRDSSGTVNGALHSIDKLLNLSKTNGREFLPSEAKAQAQALQAMLKGALRTEIVGPGAVNESEWKLLNDIVADPTKVMQLDGNTRVRLETLKETLIDGLRSKAAAQGIKIANVGFQKR